MKETMPALVSAQPGGKVNHFGIEVVKGITWQGWEPGREYTKNLVLKNVRVKTQKLRYKVPQSRFFHTLYPQPIVLSAGTSFTLPVTFRPLEKLVYSDKIEFTTNTGTFEVPITAILPQYGIVVPEHLHFNMCATEDLISYTFDIKSVSELVTPFQIECEDPFTTDTPEGVLEPYGTMTVTATFKPKAAVVYEGEAAIKFGANFDHAKVLKLEGIGKFPHLLVACSGQPSALTPGGLESIVNFGEVPIGQSVEKWVELRNLSPVNAPFMVNQEPGQLRIDTVFSCPQKHGVVPAQGTVRIPFIYSPNTVGTTSIDYFNVVAIGNVSRTIVKCVASSRGPRVRLSHMCVNFMQVNSKYRATKTIELFNESDIPASYQFMLDSEESVFKISESSGTLPPQSHRSVNMHFEPVHPINYYRKVMCLVHNQGVIPLELLGTCHTESQKPAILRQQHVMKYLTHVHRGLSFTPPERLNEMVSDGELQVGEDGCLFNPKEPKEGSPAVLDAMDEYFNDGYYSDITMLEPHVSMDIHEADFGQCYDLQCVHKQNVNITNHTQGKITVVWTGDAGHVFSVSPAVVDIPPLKSAPFSITFKPGVPNQFFGSELECYAYYKSLRDFRLVEENTHSPPWCLTLTATGHTFLPNNETFLPRVKLDTPRLIFPAVNAKESTYRTLMLANTGSTPVLFDFEKDPQGVFSVKPTRGLLVGSHQMFTVKVLPPEVKTYKHTLKLKLNDAEKNTQEIVAWGSAESASVFLEDSGELYFKPTCVGTASHRSYAVKNASRIPLKYEWKMKGADSKLLSVSPAEGIIQPNEKQFHEWTFVPSDQDKCILKPSLVVCGQGHASSSSAGKQQHFPLRVIGQGSIGHIKSDQSYVDMGTVVVGSNLTQQFSIFNEGDCNLHYRLSVDQTITGPYPEEITRDDPIALVLDNTEGMLPARSRKTITASVRPHRRVYYQFSVSYQLLTPRGEVADEAVKQPQHICHILTTGVFPTLAVSDARCYGSLNTLSKKQLWSLFSLDSLNVSLDADPAPGELMYSASTRHSHKRRPPVYTRAVLDFNFGAAPQGSEPSIVQMSVENTGTVTCQWSFLMPRDLQLETECWAETGEMDDETLHEMKVMDNNLFTMEPKVGCLEPGQSQTITFRYSHDMTGTDRLPVLLKIAQGREILLNFIGVTVPGDKRYIHFPSNQHMFEPTPIGDKSSPTQMYELYNGGALPVKYEINCVPLEVLRQENYDHAVFECLSPYGEIGPGMTANIEWRFSPLEAKTYTVDIPIKIHNGDTALVTFTGLGYDKRMMGDTLSTKEKNTDIIVPSSQSVPVPGQFCFLSSARVLFGNLPLFSTVRRVIVMTNTSTEDAVRFEWHVTSKKDAKIVSISPSCGTLKPGQANVCKVIFTATGLPSFYDLDLVCEVTNLDELAEYRREVKAWEEESERQSIEFTITERDVTGLQDMEERPASGKLLPLDGNRTPTPERELSRYMTLPPIRQKSVDRMRAQQKLETKVEDEYWAYPQPPKSFLLHLGVTARTHDVAEYQLNFPEEYNYFFIDRLLSEREKEEEVTENGEVVMAGEERMIPCLQAEADVVAAALNNILRTLLDDSSFHNAVQKIGEEQTPYFQQVTMKGPTSRHVTPTPSIMIHSTESEADFTLPETTVTINSSATTPVTHTQDDEPERPATPVESERGSPTRSRSKTSSTQDAVRQSLLEEQTFIQRGNVKKMPEFGSLIESVLENTISNIVSEAFTHDFNITARPRLVALPPRPRSATADKNNNRNGNESLSNLNNQSKTSNTKMMKAASRDLITA